ncbi:MAG: hypothetical protein EA381_10335 [Planctomycetaceae bacterium]|nr:MAG: hypothetical protein EA381_10335 [Planctomycetaceae bacterium]
MQADVPQQAGLSQASQPQAAQTHSPPAQQVQVASQAPQAQASIDADSAKLDRTAMPMTAPSSVTANRMDSVLNILITLKKHGKTEPSVVRAVRHNGDE